MHGIEVGIRATESRGIGIVAMNLVRTHRFRVRHILNPVELDIAVGMMVEFVAETLTGLSSRHIYVGFTLRIHIPVRKQVVGIFHPDLGSGWQLRHLHLEPARQHAPHVDHDAAVGETSHFHRFRS